MLYKRYLDDVVVSYDKTEDMNCLLNKHNAHLNYINLSCEEKNN